MPKEPDAALIFEVSSSVDLGIKTYYMTDARAHHIRTGHRDLAMNLHLLVKPAIENPTQVYASSYDPSRFQFVSADITTKGGNPIMVVVQRALDKGEVITATPKGKISGYLHYESSNTIHTTYDAEVDVFYFSRGDAKEAIADEDDGILYRRAEDDGTPLGVTVLDFRKRWRGNRDGIAKIIADHLRLMPGEVVPRIAFAFG